MSPDNQELWARVLGEIAGRIRPELVGEWLADLDPLDCSPQLVRLAAASSLHARMVEDHYRDIIADCFAELLGSRPEVRVVTRTPAAPAAEAAARGPGSWNPAFRLDRFVEGGPCRLALAACRAVVDRPGELYNPLFIHGPSGTGKTHLLQAVCAELAPRGRSLYLSAEDFSSRLAAGAGSEDRFREELRSADVLALDDVQTLRDREGSLEALFHLFNTLYNRNSQMLFAADVPPRALEGLPERLTSRFTWGLTVEIEPPLFENRLEILASKAAARGLDVPREVLEELAGAKTGNVRELEGMLARLTAGSGTASRPEARDKEAARAVVAATPASAVVGRPPSTDEILRAVATAYSLKPTDLLGPSRSRSVAMARHVAIYLTKELTSLPIQEIGGHFGGRDHSTVNYAISKVAALIASDGQMARAVSKLRQQLSGAKRVGTHP